MQCFVHIRDLQPKVSIKIKCAMPHKKGPSFCNALFSSHFILDVTFVRVVNCFVSFLRLWAYMNVVKISSLSDAFINRLKYKINQDLRYVLRFCYSKEFSKVPFGQVRITQKASCFMLIALAKVFYVKCKKIRKSRSPFFRGPLKMGTR